MQNFRCFSDTSKPVEFYEGLNVLIGENNSGKTTILKALQLIFDNSVSKKLSIDDFYKGISSFDEPPQITITISIQETESEKIEDKAVVATWLTKLNSPWEATLTYKYFLPDTDLEEYKKELKERDQSLISEWDILERFLQRYVSRIYAGNPISKNRVESEYLEKFDCTFLDALRNVENSIYNGKNSLLKNVLSYFLDYNLKSSIKKLEQSPKDTGSEEELDDCLKKLESCRNEFRGQSKDLLNSIKDRLDTDYILNLVESTGADVCGRPDIDGELSESDILSTLKLIIENNYGLQIPISNNGLGYNNLIYISLVLSNLEIITSDHFGENAKIFPILLIEEPEAHLHPALQYNFLRFLKGEIKNKNISRQIFVTTHSTHITAAVGLDSIICMESHESQISARYPSLVFSDKKDDIESKKYIERYLDATKSNMLFSKGVIFVEGLAEQLLVPRLAEYRSLPLDKYHIAVVGVGGSTFKHFIKLFGGGIDENNKNYTLSKRVSCIVDVDPQKIPIEGRNRRWKKCWPFEVGQNSDSYEYKPISSVITNLEEALSKSNTENVKIFYNKTQKGKTLEYDLAFENKDSPLLVSGSVEISEDVSALIESSILNSEDKSKAIFAASYLESVEDTKGSMAFELANNLINNFNLSDGPLEFNLPLHIKNAISWVCGGVYNEPQ
jgi:putative ATP-dependent endonuclease of OLD family